MSGSLKRALGLWVASKVPGLSVYSDDLANDTHRYPSCTITEIAHDTGPFGCGKCDYKVRDGGSGYVSSVGRMHREATTFRLTISAPSDTHKNGQEIVDELADTLERAIYQSSMSNDRLVLRDTETTPEILFPIESMRPQGRQSLPPDTTSEPVLYRVVTSVQVTRLVPIERQAEGVIEQIHIAEE